MCQLQQLICSLVISNNSVIMIAIQKQKLVETQYMHDKVIAPQNVNACEAL